MGFDPEKDKYLDDLLQKYFGAEFFNPNHSEVEQYFKVINSTFKQSKTKIITIAGTNGKGQTAHFLNDYLTSKGFKTSLWTSPHVLSVTERFKFNEKFICHDRLEEVFKETYSKGLKLSYYEFLFYCFCTISLELELDYLILEVGLGGRLDAVNYLDADYTLLTSISKDHEEFLGGSLSGILKEKLGITRMNAPHFSSLEQEFLRIRQKSLLNDHAHCIDLFDIGFVKKTDDYFTRNKLLALYFLKNLLNSSIDREEALKELDTFVCSVTKGRQEEVTINNIKFIFIGAHNVDGIRKMRDYFLASESFLKSDLLCAFSKRKNEDIVSSINILKSSPCLWNSINITSFKHLKSLPLEDLPQVDDVNLISNLEDFLDQILNCNKGQWIVTGSYYFIGEVQKYLNTRFSIL